MNVICPICNQTLNAAGVPPATEVNCPSCRNNFLTPDYAEVLPVAQYQATTVAATPEHLHPSSFFSKITTFQGRIGRLQYFYGLLFKWVIMFAVSLIIYFSFSVNNEMDGITMIISLPLCLFVILVNLSLQVRRLHDMGQSGFWLLLYLVPFLNYIFALIIFIACLASEGNKNANKYGTAPHRIF